jgi:phospholipase C
MKNWLALAVIATAFALCACGESTASHFAPAVSDSIVRVQMTSAPGNVLKDPGFESGGFTYWKQCGTVPPSIQTGIVHAGKYAEYGGTQGDPEINGDAAVCQSVTVPAYGRLSFWLNATTTDTVQYAWESASILDTRGKVLQTIFKAADNTGGWTHESFDASAYAGKKVKIQFDVHGNGYQSAYINAYVDDVSLQQGTPTPSPAPTASPVAGSPIQHVIIVLQENRTFDNIFHGYPGANYATTGKLASGKTIRLRQVPLMTPWDPGHTYSDWISEYNNGAMNGFEFDDVDYGSGAPANFAYSYAAQRDVQPYWDLAKEGVLGDDTFADHRSQSFSGHLFPIAGASGPISPNLKDYYASDDPSGGESCQQIGSGTAVNIVTGAQDKNYQTCMDFQTIADLMNKRGVSWKYYVDSASRYDYVSAFSVIKHIYNSKYFTDNVISPETTVLSDLQDGKLAAVSYVIGTFADSDHPGQNVPSSNGPRYVSSVFNAVGRSQYWKNTVVILMYDDWGGWYDHVAPKTFNQFEAGFRIPFVVVSPYAKRGYISHKAHYQGSVLHFIEDNWNLGSLHTSDSRSDALEDCFDYKQKPLQYITVDGGDPAGLVDADLLWYGRTPHGADRD